MKKVVTFGEIMMRLSPQGYLRFSQATNFDATYGGAEANVAVSLANFGLPVDFVTRVPSNEIAQSAVMELKKRSVGVDKILYGGDRLGIYFLETGAVNRGSKVVYDRAYSAMAEIQLGMIDWETVFTDAHWFHFSGITPAISKNAAAVSLEAVKKASEMGLTISIDFNFRTKLWNYCNHSYIQELMTELTSYCDIIIGNERDAKNFFDIEPIGIEDTNDEVSLKTQMFYSVSKQMMQKFPKAKKIATTIRGSVSASHNSWCGLLYNGSELFTTKQYQITDIVDRVGGGDSFMGGVIYGLMTYPNDDKKTIDFATAASCLKHTIKGDVNLVTVEEVEFLLSDSSGNVSR